MKVVKHDYIYKTGKCSRCGGKIPANTTCYHDYRTGKLLCDICMWQLENVTHEDVWEYGIDESGNGIDCAVCGRYECAPAQVGLPYLYHRNAGKFVCGECFTKLTGEEDDDNL